ncbi:MAG: outer-membrane lipoprotein carrier protein LolA [Cardiobacteriaceae bacterium]|nr:outer-membrane lipoprotein carrier protein LolA [Cardiobacteriaceae bacterium]
MRHTVKTLALAAFVTSGIAHAQLFNKTAADDEQKPAESVQIQPAPQAPETQPLQLQPAPAADSAKPADKVSLSGAHDNALTRYLLDTRDLQGAFTQTVYGGRGEQKTTGQMWMAKPGKFHWDYQSPSQQIIVSDGKKVIHYDVDLEQIAVRSRDELVGDVAMELLNGNPNLGDKFNISTIVRNKAPARLQGLAGAGGTIYQLRPKKAQNEYDAVWVVMNNGDLAAVMVDGGSQQTIIRFNGLKRNAGVPASKFKFTPPPGVDVIGEL